MNPSIICSLFLLSLLCLFPYATVHAEELLQKLPDSAPVAAPVPTAITAPPATSTEAVFSPVGRFFTEGEWYFSWGYSTETWSPSDIHVSQPALGNDFTIHNVTGHDEPNLGNIISTQIFVPQYNIRIGRFVDADRTLAVELSLDHTKYTSTIGQTARVTGTIEGKPAPPSLLLDDKNFRYNLHNGANHLMVNIVKRVPLIGATNESFSLAAIGKVGAGLMVPHSDNTILGNKNDVGEKKISNFFGTKRGWWQFDGWTAGVEAGLRFVAAKPVYLELTDKIAYASLYDIPVYMGTATQSLWMNEVILSLGFTYDGAKKGGTP
jgi:hypothetical protein